MTDTADKFAENSSQIVLYRTDDGKTRLQVRLEDENVWLTQKLMAELFQKDVRTINEHIQNIFEESELQSESVIRKFRITAEDGKSYDTNHYNLDVIISVGYRVKSQRGTQFRIWATQRLGEFLVKGFTLDDDRLKGRDKLADYFDELLARIREIRASERRVYQRIREIFSLASDYHEREVETQDFFAVMQNKMHYAATELTAAEIVRRRADASKSNMGLTSWGGSRVLKRDVATAKNYLTEEEVDTLNRIVVMFLDQAEFRAKRRQDIKMRDWTVLLDKFLRDTDLPVLDCPGSVSHDEALSWAEAQYDALVERRRLEAEQAAEARYLTDLRTSAKAFEAERKKLPPAGKKVSKKRKRGGGKWMCLLMLVAASVVSSSCAPAEVREDTVASGPEVAPDPAPAPATPLPAHSVLSEQEFMQSFDEHLTSFPTLSATAATYTNFLEAPMEFFETLQLADARVIYVRKAGWSTAVALSDKTGRGMEDEKMVPHKGKVVSVQLMSESPVLLMLTYEDQPSVEDSSVRLKVFHVKKDRLKEIEDIELRRNGDKPLPAFDSTVQVCQGPLRLEVERRTVLGETEKTSFTWNAFKEAFVRGR